MSNYVHSARTGTSLHCLSTASIGTLCESEYSIIFLMLRSNEIIFAPLCLTFHLKAISETDYMKLAESCCCIWRYAESSLCLQVSSL